MEVHFEVLRVDFSFAASDAITGPGIVIKASHLSQSAFHSIEETIFCLAHAVTLTGWVNRIVWVVLPVLSVFLWLHGGSWKLFGKVPDLSDSEKL